MGVHITEIHNITKSKEKTKMIQDSFWIQFLNLRKNFWIKVLYLNNSKNILINTIHTMKPPLSKNFKAKEEALKIFWKNKAKIFNIEYKDQELNWPKDLTPFQNKSGYNEILYSITLGKIKQREILRNFTNGPDQIKEPHFSALINALEDIFIRLSSQIIKLTNIQQNILSSFERDKIWLHVFSLIQPIVLHRYRKFFSKLIIFEYRISTSFH